MHWWLVTRLRILEFRRRLVDWVREVPAVALLMGFALLGMAFLMVSVYRAVYNAPIVMATQQLPVILRMSLVAGVLAALGLAPKELMPRGLLPALPLADGVIVLGAVAPLMMLSGLLGVMLVGPGIMALARAGVMTGLVAWFSGMAVVILQVSTSWLALVTGFMAGRWRIAAALLFSSLVWTLLGSAQLNPFAPTPWLIVGVVLLLGVDLLATVWLVRCFHRSFETTEVGTAPPLGHQLIFPRGRLAWLGLEARLALRDRKGWLFNATVTGSLWMLLALLMWFPTLFGKGGEVQSQRLAAASRYFTPAIYLSVLLLAGGALRARGQDVPREAWLISLPLRVGDYVLSKGVVHILLAGASWLVCMAGLSVLIQIPLSSVIDGLRMAALFAAVVYSFAYFWGTIIPLDDQESIQSLVSLTLFGMATMALYQVTAYIERAAQADAALITGLGLSLLFLVMSILVEERRRGGVV